MSFLGNIPELVLVSCSSHDAGDQNQLGPGVRCSAVFYGSTAPNSLLDLFNPQLRLR